MMTVGKVRAEPSPFCQALISKPSPQCSLPCGRATVAARAEQAQVGESGVPPFNPLPCECSFPPLTRMDLGRTHRSLSSSRRPRSHQCHWRHRSTASPTRMRTRRALRLAAAADGCSAGRLRGVLELRRRRGLCQQRGWDLASQRDSTDGISLDWMVTSYFIADMVVQFSLPFRLDCVAHDVG